VDHGQVKLLSEVRGLVEAAAKPAPWVKGDWNDAVGVDQEVRPLRAQQLGKRLCEGSAAFVLEGVDDVAERAVIETGAGMGLDPAAAADGTVKGFIERDRARGTSRRESHGDQGIDQASANS
jgi:hypothetical protein